MKGFTVKAVISRCSSLRDKGLSIGFHTSKELNEQDAWEILKSDGKEGWLLFKENEVKEEEIPTTDAEIDVKTSSQRLRATLYVLWSQLGSKGKFEDYYREKMEGFINAVKQKLD